jgi:ribonuclease E
VPADGSFVNFLNLAPAEALAVAGRWRIGEFHLMTKRMLIDATHAEETRVVVLDGNRLEDFDVETSTKKQLKGNIYLARVVRVEPSLQAAFVEYGGGRHGFLAFSEIHPDYYQIPVADRQRLLALQAAEAEEDEDDEGDSEAGATEAAAKTLSAAAEAEADSPAATEAGSEALTIAGSAADHVVGDEALPVFDQQEEEPQVAELAVATAESATATEDEADSQPPETVGGEVDGGESGEGGDEARARRTARFLRNYRIQEVIKRRQIMLVQVVKEERGTKGAALTTYISLAGRFCVLMPNSPRGGGVSRKITSAADRKRLREVISELEIPDGMALIVRTAGANRPKPEIKRDCEYLMRLWDDIREHTLRSVAPTLIYEEASLIKRSIRDVYSRDIDEIIVDGEAGWHAAHDFMRMLMPAHAHKVVLWRDPSHSLFVHYQVEAQLDAMLQPTVQLRSGGYLVINQTEALVAIDVNSGRSTRERGIEETALRTNLEASDEVARQLRLRDLAGLVVIDYIDMESKKNNAAVEHRLKEALKVDRARIQVGHISHFGLLEMSRQRLRPSLAETSFVPCPHCGGLGQVRSVESSALHVLRAIEEEGAKGRASEIEVRVASPIIVYMLNHKRQRLAEIEARTTMLVRFAADDTLVPPQIQIERLKAQTAEDERPAPVMPEAPAEIEDYAEIEADAAAPDSSVATAAELAVAETEPAEAAESPEGREKSGRRRRRGRRSRRGERETGSARASVSEASEVADAGPALTAEQAEAAQVEVMVQEDSAALVSDQPEIPPGAFPVLPEPLPTPPRATPVATSEEPVPPMAEARALEPLPAESQAASEEKKSARRRSRRAGGRRGEKGVPGAQEASAEAVAGEVIAELADSTQAAASAGSAAEPQAASLQVQPEPAAEVAVQEKPAAAAAQQPAPAEAKEVVAGPAVVPLVIGKDPIPLAAPKRGWWRR